MFVTLNKRSAVKSLFDYLFCSFVVLISYRFFATLRMTNNI